MIFPFFSTTSSACTFFLFLASYLDSEGIALLLCAISILILGAAEAHYNMELGGLLNYSGIAQDFSIPRLRPPPLAPLNPIAARYLT